MKNGGLIIGLLAIGAPLILVFGLLGFVFLGTNTVGASQSVCTPGEGANGAEIDPDDLPVDQVGPWKSDQLVNAAWIIKAGADMGLGSREITIGVVTAMAESSLMVLDKGDDAGPDSRGLFQQRDDWGSYEDRMDPYRASQLFFDALLQVPERE